MGANIPIWVEVEEVITKWVKSYGVVGSEAEDRVEEEYPQYTAIGYSYEDPYENK